MVLSTVTGVYSPSEEAYRSRNGNNTRSNNMITKNVHIADLRVGDTILHENKPKTLSRASFSYDEFLGRRVDGDSYQLGHKPVQLITKL